VSIRGTEPYLCVDIHLGQMAAIEVRSGAVVRWFREPIRPEWMKQGDPVAVSALAQVLRGGVQAAGMRSRQVRLTLCDEAAVVRRVRMPVMAKKDLAGAMRFAAEREMPFPPQRAVYAWDVVSTEGSLTISVAAAWKDVVDRAAAVVVQAGLVPTVIEPRSIALGRALNSENAIIVDGSAGMLEMTVLAAGHPVYSDSIPRNSESNGQAVDIEALISRGHRHFPAAASSPVLLVGDLESELDQVRVRARRGTSLLNGTSPARPPDLPAAGFLANFGLAMR